MTSDNKNQEREVADEIARSTSSLAQLGPAGRKKKRSKRPEAPKTPTAEPAPEPTNAQTQPASAAPSTDTITAEGATPSGQPEPQSAEPSATKASRAPTPPKPKRSAPKRGRETNPASAAKAATYRLRLPVDLAAQFDELVAEREVAYSYAIRLAFARNHEKLTAAITSEEAKLLEAAGMEPPSSRLSPAIGETEMRSYTVSRNARAALQARADELKLTVAAMLREVLRIEVEAAQHSPT